MFLDFNFTVFRCTLVSFQSFKVTGIAVFVLLIHFEDFDKAPFFFLPFARKFVTLV